ncbi:MAG: hypothetical protein J6U14_10445 [Bacteroidaceae bacterium]|nr:hypothetical protein [Bacteroidaceae bacterium]
MSQTITFKDIPFMPEDKNIFYIENECDVKVNQYIRDNYSTIKAHFNLFGLRFIYLPLLLKDMEHEGVLSYFAPYLSPEEVSTLHISSSWLMDYQISPNKEDIQPSLIYRGRSLPNGAFSYNCIPIHEYNYAQTNNFSVLLDIILGEMQMERKSVVLKQRESERKKESILNKVRKSFDSITGDLFDDIKSSKRAISHCSESEELPTLADDTFSEESQRLLIDVQNKIALLLKMGVDINFLEELIHQKDIISRMIINKRFDIILPDYNNMKIEMTPLCKALYILFLRHPEGIMFSYLPDYHDELLRIYTQIRGGYQTETMRKSVERLTNPFDNSINEKCARISESFLSQFDARLAKNYVIDGNRGEPKTISLPRNMVIWE